ncbi:hydroxycarboxylic acid receptor 1 [Fukomys damarensis]|uniref:hydroxycarboxylic acid receptor 1 n=1 Tax=Fukomys damarensis TaxID=885580 RepID=UPI00054036CA|nr:hydroxycarboxylic acid receptor 1 [Fukomys damarensis]
MDNGSCCLLEGDPISKVMPPLLILAFVLGALGNGIALCGFCFHVKTWKPSTVYLFNLAVADFLLMICLPFRTDYYRRHRHWGFEDVPCRLVLFMLATNRAGSIVFLTVVAVDRYFKVVHPHHALNAISNRTAVGAACALWTLVILGTLYLLLESHLCAREEAVSCESFIMESANGWHDVMFQLEFFLPLGVVLFCSAKVVWRLRRRRQLARQPDDVSSFGLCALIAVTGQRVTRRMGALLGNCWAPVSPVVAGELVSVPCSVGMSELNDSSVLLILWPAVLILGNRNWTKSMLGFWLSGPSGLGHLRLRLPILLVPLCSFHCPCRDCQVAREPQQNDLALTSECPHFSADPYISKKVLRVMFSCPGFSGESRAAILVDL